jgi:hypothetical protein
MRDERVEEGSPFDTADSGDAAANDCGRHEVRARTRRRRTVAEAHTVHLIIRRKVLEGRNFFYDLPSLRAIIFS